MVYCCITSSLYLKFRRICLVQIIALNPTQLHESGTHNRANIWSSKPRANLRHVWFNRFAQNGISVQSHKTDCPQSRACPFVNASNAFFLPFAQLYPFKTNYCVHRRHAQPLSSPCFPSFCARKSSDCNSQTGPAKKIPTRKTRVLDRSRSVF